MNHQSSMNECMHESPITNEFPNGSWGPMAIEIKQLQLQLSHFQSKLQSFQWQMYGEVYGWD
jgi:hypothetical protein